jgi:hypothetical protein
MQRRPTLPLPLRCPTQYPSNRLDHCNSAPAVDNGGCGAVDRGPAVGFPGAVCLPKFVACTAGCRCYCGPARHECACFISPPCLLHAYLLIV